MHLLFLIVAIVWALPWTLFGLAWGGLGLLTGAQVQRQGRVIEFWGGGLAWCLRRLPIVAGAAAVTFGHTVLARGKDELEYSRDHEFVHVRQYERWGLFFIPAYLGASAWAWLRGRDPYLDNPFERQAYEEGTGER